MNGPALLALQLIDSDTDHVEHRRKRLPEAARHAEASAAVKALQQRLAEARQRGAEAEAAIAAAEQESAALTTKRTRLEGQLKTVISPREAEALMHEIELLTAKRGEQDDLELAALDDAAAADGEATALEAELASAVGEAQVTAAELATAQRGLDGERQTLLASRPAAVAALPADELATYERMRAQFGGVAVAKLDGTRCQGCHLDLSRGEVDAIRALPADEAGECPQCNRLLVR